MTYNRLLWLPAALRAAGLTVHEISGWQDRGHTDDTMFLRYGFDPQAVVFHHDASAPGDSPGALNWLITGFDSSSDTNYDAQCWVDRYGVWYIVAAGYAQHAGAGDGWGAIPAGMGNPRSFGVETDHTTGEAWPPAQYASVRTGMAAICLDRGWDPARCVVGHKEYAPGRKDDPDPVDMAQFRAEVAAMIVKGWDDVSYDDVVRALRDVLRLPANGLAVPRGQVDNGNLAAILVGLAQDAVNRDNIEAGRLAGLATDADGVAAAVAQISAVVDAVRADVDAGTAKTLATLAAMNLDISDDQLKVLADRMGIDYDRIARLVNFQVSIAPAGTGA